MRPGRNDGDLDKDATVTGREEDDNRRCCNGGGSELSDVLDVADAATEEEEPEDVVVASDGGFIEEDADVAPKVVDGSCDGIGCAEGARLSRSSLWRDLSISDSCSSASCVTLIPNWDPHMSIDNDALEVEGSK